MSGGAAKQDLASAVFTAVYASREQRLLRVLAVVLLSLRHAVRGIVFSWPLYFVALLPFLLPVESGWWIILFIFPAIIVSLTILVKGVKDDYQEEIAGKLLEGRPLIKILWWGL